MTGTLLVFILYTYSTIICTKAVDVGYSTNRLIIQVPCEEIATKELDCSQNMTYERPVSIAFQKTLKSWSYRDSIQPLYAESKILSSKSNYRKAFNDDQWSEMWYLQDFRTDRSQSVLDMNVVPVYFALGITGKYVNISIVDTGIEWSHPDLVSKFSPELSWNYLGENNDILPDYNDISKEHGTKSTGVIMMQPNNKLCGVGIAYGATFGGVNVLGGSTSLLTKALGHAEKYVDIYSNSWGNYDTGDTTIPLNEFTDRMLSWTTTYCRNGKGSIYVFAAGNGRDVDDHCSCDGYVNSIHTIAVAACDDSGHPTYYSERCAGIMATSYSGRDSKRGLVSTIYHGKCTNDYFGTSAATPIVSGVIALGLSMNPQLTWRDILHLLAWTCQVAPLSDNLGWNRNKAGFYYSVDFGFGLINAYKLVRAAKNWKNVPKMNTCGIRMPKVENVKVTRKSGTRIIVTTNSCQGLSNEVNFIEQIHLVLTMNYSRRGDIQIAMKSPAGTDVMVLESRSKDINDTELNRYKFLVLAFWGESPRGQFFIDIFDKTGYSTNEGHILEMALVIYGTNEAPKKYNKGPRPYDAFKLDSSGQNPKFGYLGSKNGNKVQESNSQNYGNSPNNYAQYYSNYQYPTHYGYNQNYNTYSNSTQNNMYYYSQNRPQWHNYY